jgi:predicted RNA-binding protein associated with RNAse of E/G family
MAVKARRGYSVPKLNLPRPVTVVYRRLPNDVRELPGILRRESRSRLVVEMVLKVSSPRRMFGKTVVDTGFTAIWFVYRDRWYDIAKFYDQAGRFTGYYCDILKPQRKLLLSRDRTTTLTDLFLDLWITPSGKYVILDEDEFQNAVTQGYISKTLANEARKHLNFLIRQVKRGRFPSKSVKQIELLHS